MQAIRIQTGCTQLNAMTVANPYQGSGVKRADGCTTGAEWPSEEQVVNHPGQAVAADFISVAGHSREAAPNTDRGSMFPRSNVPRETVASADPTSEKLFCALIPVFSTWQVVLENTPR